MVKQKIVLKVPLDDERKKRKAFKAAVGMSGVTSATLEGDKIIVVGDGVDPIALTTVLRRGLGRADLLAVSSGDDKKNGGGGGTGISKHGIDTTKPISSTYPPVYTYPYQYNTVPSYPSYPYHYQQQEGAHDPGCSIM